MPVEYVDITDAEDAGQRIDNFLLRSLKGLPRQRIYKILRSGEVRVNGGRISPVIGCNSVIEFVFHPLLLKQNNRYKWQMLR